MVRDHAKLREFEKRLVASEPVDFARNLRLAEDLYELARELGRFPGPDPLEGLDINICLVKVFRSVPRPS